MRGAARGGREMRRKGRGEKKGHGTCEDVEDASERVRAAGEGGGLAWLEQAAVGDDDVDEVVEAVVEDDVGVEHHDHVGAAEHAEHVLVQQEVDRAARLRVRACHMSTQWEGPSALPTGTHRSYGGRERQTHL